MLLETLGKRKRRGVATGGKEEKQGQLRGRESREVPPAIIKKVKPGDHIPSMHQLVASLLAVFVYVLSSSCLVYTLGFIPHSICYKSLIFLFRVSLNIW